MTQNLLELQKLISQLPSDELRNQLNAGSKSQLPGYMIGSELTKRAEQSRSYKNAINGARVRGGNVMQEIMREAGSIGPAQPAPQRLASGGLVMEGYQHGGRVMEDLSVDTRRQPTEEEKEAWRIYLERAAGARGMPVRTTDGLGNIGQTIQNIQTLSPREEMFQEGSPSMIDSIRKFSPGKMVLDLFSSSGAAPGGDEEKAIVPEDTGSTVSTGDTGVDLSSLVTPEAESVYEQEVANRNRLAQATALATMAASFADPKNATGSDFGDFVGGFAPGALGAAEVMESSAGHEAALLEKQRTREDRTTSRNQAIKEEAKKALYVYNASGNRDIATTIRSIQTEMVKENSLFRELYPDIDKMSGEQLSAAVSNYTQIILMASGLSTGQPTPGGGGLTPADTLATKNQ